MTEGYCLDYDDCPAAGDSRYPATTFEELTYSFQYLSGKNSSGGCTPPKQPSSVVGDSTNSFCIDPTYIAPISQYFADLTNGILPSFVFIELGYGENDEHPGSGNNILNGQVDVPPNGAPTIHCDLSSGDPGTNPDDAAAEQGFAAQLGFRVPNMIIPPFTIAHYAGHNPMDHTAIIKFVENRFIGSSAHLTARDAAQPNLLDFFDFTDVPWATPPAPVADESLGVNTCTPASMGP